MLNEICLTCLIKCMQNLFITKGWTQWTLLNVFNTRQHFLFLGVGKGPVGRNCTMSLAGSRCLIGGGLDILTIFYKIHNGFTPSYLSDHIPKRNVIDISLRNGNENPPLIRTERYKNSFFLILINFGKPRIMLRRNLNLPCKASKSISTTLFDLLITPFRNTWHTWYQITHQNQS